MHIVAIAFKIDLPGQSGVILRRLQLHLEGKRKIVLQIFIVEIGNVSGLLCSGQSIKEHKTRRRSPVEIHDQSGLLRHLVPVQVNHDLYGRILLKQLFDLRQCLGICLVSDRVVLRRMVKNLVAICICQKLCQILSDADD